MNLCITRSVKFAYSETFIRDQIAGLQERTAVYTLHSGRYPEREENGTLLSPRAFWLAHKGIKTLVGRNNYFSDYGVKKYLKTHKIDVVLANYGISAAHMLVPCRALNIPLLAVFRGHDVTDKKLLAQYAEKYKALFQYATFLIAVSERLKKQLISLGAPEEKIKIIPSGVNTSKFIPSTEVIREKHFLGVGRFTPKKGPLHTLRAFHTVLEKFPEATLTLAGKKDGLFEACEALVKKLGMEKSVQFTGVLDHNQVPVMMQNSLAFVQHSLTAPNGDTEGTPVGIMEASASGLPVVSTRHGGIPDAVIHEKTGYLVEEGDDSAMGQYMIKLCENPEHAREMGLAGRKHMQEHYEHSDQISKLLALAKAAIDKKT
ncbi:glycosyltransferase [Robiginitalea sp.]|uniref:glycosyltransferase n=3 Tax=Robiginitalea sp. TaxID=1902411 RepID=UPI003C7285E8